MRGQGLWGDILSISGVRLIRLAELTYGADVGDKEGL